MNIIPTRPVWLVIGRDSETTIKVFERYFTQETAELRLTELRDNETKLTFKVDESQSIIPDRTLPTSEQLRALCELMHRAFVQIRILGHAKKSELIAEFADILHNLPKEMFEEQNWDWNSLEYALQEFQKKHPDDTFFPFAAMLGEIKNSEKSSN